MREMLCGCWWCRSQRSLFSRARRRLDLSLLSLLYSCSFCASFCEDDVRPSLCLASVFAYDIRKDFHPSILFGSAIGIEVDGLAVGETDTEAFLDKHVTLFFFGKRGLSSTALLRGDVVAH